MVFKRSCCASSFATAQGAVSSIYLLLLRWMLFGQDKMSKSKGNVIYADELVNRFGVDAVRYYSLKEMPFAQDGSITYETIISRYNSDLANTSACEIHNAF